MPRGKHKARSAKRRAERAGEAARSLASRADAERAAALRAQQARRDMDEVLAQVAALEGELAERVGPEMRALTAEMVTMQASLDELGESPGRQHDRAFEREQVTSGAGWTEYAERLISTADRQESTVTTGIARPEKLSVAAMKQIQRARGLR